MAKEQERNTKKAGSGEIFKKVQNFIKIFKILINRKPSTV